jgi:hypothetical protein
MKAMLMEISSEGAAFVAVIAPSSKACLILGFTRIDFQKGALRAL